MPDNTDALCSRDESYEAETDKMNVSKLEHEIQKLKGKKNKLNTETAFVGGKTEPYERDCIKYTTKEANSNIQLQIW